LTPYIPYSAIQRFVPRGVYQPAASVETIERFNTSLATGSFVDEACASWANITKPFHCVERRVTYGPLAAISLACSVVATLLPIYIVLLKALFGKLRRS